MNGTSTEDIGMLDLITTRYLHSLGKFSELLFTAVLSSSSLNTILRKPNHKKTIVDISVNIIGPERIANDVGDILADDSAYLQHPFFLETGTRYINPQYFYSRNENTDLKHLIGPPTIDSKSVRVSEGVENLLESLDDLSRLAVPLGSQAVSAAAGGRLILTPLKRFGLPVAVKWSLLFFVHLTHIYLTSHQEDGLKFILNRENPTFCDSVISDLKALIGSRFVNKLLVP